MKKIFSLVILLSITLFSQEKEKKSVQLQGVSVSPEYQKVIELREQENFNREAYYEAFSEYISTLDTIKGNGVKPFERAKYFYGTRMAGGDKPNYNKLYKDFDNFERKQQSTESFQNANEWQELGPFRSPRGIQGGGPTTRGTGRINSIEVDPKNSNILWVGAAGGGIWKSTDKGQTWEVFEETDFGSIGISDISIAKNNTNIVYAASGDKNARFAGGQDVMYFSAGLYKTTNGGLDWTIVSPFANNNTSNGIYMNDVEVSPDNDNHVYLATTAGLYKTENGGNTWDMIINVDVSDIKINPGNSNLIHCAVRSGGSYALRTYNDDNGQFTQLYTLPNSRRIEIAVTPDNPNTVYAIGVIGRVFGWLVKSNDAGETWNVQVSRNDGVNYMGSDNGSGSDFNRGQGEFDLCIAVNPNDDNDVVIGGINLWRSRNGGVSFNRISSWWSFNASPAFTHADQHEIEWIDEDEFYIGNDGGLYRSNSNFSNYEDLNDGLHITQFYRFSSSQENETLILGGTQDNSTWLRTSNGWFSTNVGGDGFHAEIDPLDDSRMWASNNDGRFNDQSIGTGIYVSVNSGQSFSQVFRSVEFQEHSLWVAPLEVDPVENINFYFGFNNIYKWDLAQNQVSRLTNLAVQLGQEFRHIEVSPANNSFIYGVYGRNVIRSTNSGTSWENIYTSSRMVTDLEPSLEDPRKVYIAVSGFGNGDKVIEINNNSTKNISYNLPNIPANAIVQIPNTNELFVGMDIGVYRMAEDGNSWQLFNKGLTRSGISELEFQKTSGKLRASTFGRGIWEVLLIDCDMEQPQVLVDGDGSNGNIEICTGESVELRYTGDYSRAVWNNGETRRTITVSEPGEYYVTAEDGEGCFSISNVINISVNPRPEITMNITDDVVKVCEQDSVLLSVLGFFSSYEWNTGETTRNIQAKEAGDYFVTVTDFNTSCEGTSEVITVEIIPAPNKPNVEVENNIISLTPGQFGYEWYFNGELIEGAESSEYEATEDGEYLGFVVSVNGCKTAADPVTMTWFSSVELGDKRGFAVNPNPTDGLITINYPSIEIGNTSIEVINNLGTKVFSEEFFNNSQILNKTINLSNLPKGVYYVTLWNKGVRVTEKIIIN